MYGCYICGSDDIVDDCDAGEEVCRGCGTVQRERIKDIGMEWTVFDDDANEKGRAHSNENDMELLTNRSVLNNCRAATAVDVHGMSARKHVEDRLLKAVAVITSCAEKLRLRGDAITFAKEYFAAYTEYLDTEMVQSGSIEKGRKGKLYTGDRQGEGDQQSKAIQTISDDSMLLIVAGCLFYGCRKARLPLTKKEVETILRISPKGLTAVMSNIARVFLDISRLPKVPAADFAERYGRAVECPSYITCAAIEVASGIQQRDLVDSVLLSTIAAYSLYTVCKLSDEPNKHSLASVS